MGFEEFQQKLMADLEQKLIRDYGPVIIETNYLQKLQGESYNAISIQKEPGSIGASINADKLYDQLQSGQNYEAVLTAAEMLAHEGMDHVPDVAPEVFTDYSKMKEKLSVELIPQAGNEEILATVPHKDIEDMASVYRIILSNDSDGRATVLISNSLAAHLGVTPEQLHADAIANSVEHYPVTMRNMGEVIRDMLGMDSGFPVPDTPMHVMTNTDKFMGAGVILYPNVLDDAAEKLGENFFVLPSSIHEVLILPESEGHSYHKLESMVRAINENEVAPADRLSDNIYHYDADAHVFELASAYEQRLEAMEQIFADEMPSAEQSTTISVLLVEPDQYPKKIEISDELASLQKVVGGYIECVYPFEDSVGIICNEEGKMEGLPLNRALRDEEGDIYDVVAGPFLVVGLTEENFGSLTPEQMEKYEDLFHQPEAFVRTGRSIIAVPIPDEAISGKDKPTVGKSKDQPSI